MKNRETFNYIDNASGVWKLRSTFKRFSHWEVDGWACSAVFKSAAGELAIRSHLLTPETLARIPAPPFKEKQDA